MDQLTSALQASGIDVSTLQPLAGEGTDTIYSLQVHGSRAIETWKRMRALVEQTGYWPVIIGEHEELSRRLETLGYDSRSTSQIIEESKGIDPEAWLSEQAEELSAEIENDPEYGEYEYPLGDEWPDSIGPNDSFSIPDNIRTRQPHDVVYLALIPARESWETPAYLKFTAYNYDIGPEVHCAVIRRWEEMYGAEIVGMTDDTIEMQVAQPSQNRESALRLAEEQFLYCPDIVEQGVTTIKALAATLLNGSLWFFWWD